MFGTPTVRAVIKHKWRLYGRQRLTIRVCIYAVFSIAYTAFAALYSQEDRSLSLAVSTGHIISLLSVAEKNGVLLSYH